MNRVDGGLDSREGRTILLLFNYVICFSNFYVRLKISENVDFLATV